ncbi:serine O-acetyltransferase [Mesorhizobium albiziae]|uniref:Serine acetyltransferase n=1 Tax=Neomesorhizobium albiziae TaxID=335020 RepID=A0A1I4EHE0_9HYPH|nr:serine O-acetyltransferase EpsC [Mesorhizobium albiziae]GLS32004.1 serine acetyltransferase [Mesorhizobium albiziae]SFL04639.1 serine O-acetyltransferase [Mesorhizobium albiziae]
MSLIFTTTSSSLVAAWRDAKAVPPSLVAMIHEDIACVKARDPTARGTREIVLTYPGIHVIASHRLANRLWRWGFRFPARFLSRAAGLGRRFLTDHDAGFVIGETAEVGDDVTLYQGATLGGTSWAPGKRHPTLKSGVLVGAGAKILGAITAETGCRGGANAVVMEDVPPGMTLVGIAPRIVNGRIDLDHHLPDHVGDAIAWLVDRISCLEPRISRLQVSRATNASDTTVFRPGRMQ